MEVGRGPTAAPQRQAGRRSGKPRAVYSWLKKGGPASGRAASGPSGGALAFGDGYGDGNGGLVIDVGDGNYRLLRRELAAPWDSEQPLVAIYLVRD